MQINVNTPDFVLNAALTLHKQANASLDTAVSAGVDPSSYVSDDWSLNGGVLSFRSLESRNHCAALAALRDIPTPPTPEQIFERARELWRKEIGHADFASGRFLAISHQSTDVIACAADLIQQGSLQVFDVLQLIGAALPHLAKINPQSLVALAAAQHEATKGDMAAGMLFNAVENRFKNDKPLAWTVLTEIGNQCSEQLVSLYGSALYALMLSEDAERACAIALQDAESIEEPKSRVAIWLLGRAIRESGLTEQIQERAISLLIRRCDDRLVGVAQAAFAALSNAAIKQSELRDELLRRARTGDQYILAVVAHLLFMNFEQVRADPRTPELISALVQLTPDTTGGIDNFDWILHKLFREPDTKSLAISTLSSWIVAHGGSKLRDKDFVDHFDQITAELANDKPALQAVITTWLLAPEPQLAAACGGLISWLWVHGFKEPVFSQDLIDQLDANELKFLVRRMLGYVISEEPLLSMTFSLLNTKNAKQRTFPIVHALLTQEVGRDYIGFTLDGLTARVSNANDEERQMLQSAHDVLTGYTQLIEALPRLLELRPPSQLRRMISLTRSREMRRSMDQANEKSIWRQIATEVPLKAGIGWFSVSSSGVEETHQLQSHSFQASLPRRALMDPIGYAIKGMYFRIAKRDDE